MELAITLTLWISFGAFLFLPTVDAPPVFSRVAMGVCASELVAATIWAIDRDTCLERPCSSLGETARTAAGVELPALTVALIVLGTAYGLRASRS